MFHPPTWSRLVTVAAAPGTPEALATRTGTRLGGAVVVVAGWAGWVVVVGGVTTDPEADLTATGWITPSNSTVVTPNATMTMNARTRGIPPARPLDPFDGVRPLPGG